MPQLALLVGTFIESRQLPAKYGQNLLRNLSQVNRFWFGYASQQRPQNKEGYKILFTGRIIKFLWIFCPQNNEGSLSEFFRRGWVGKKGLRVQLLQQMAEVLLELTNRAGEVVNLTNYFAKCDSSATEGERVHHSGHKRRHSWKH